MSKKIVIIVVCVVVLLAIIGTTVGVSLAYWRENKYASLYAKMDIEDENPSLKYQMYVPVRATGDATSTTTSAYERVPGTFSRTGSYTLTNAADYSSIVGFALVGWYGGVSLEYIEVPDTIKLKVNNQDTEKPIVRLMVDSEFDEYSFGGSNTAIQTIIVGKNVAEVDSGMFMGMPELTTVQFVYNEDTSYYLYLRPYSFGACPNLNAITNGRSTEEGWAHSAAFVGSGS